MTETASVHARSLEPYKALAKLSGLPVSRVVELAKADDLAFAVNLTKRSPRQALRNCPPSIEARLLVLRALAKRWAPDGH